MHSGSSLRARLLASAFSVGMLSAACGAQAADQEFNIAPQSLDTALADFSRQSMVPVLATPSITGSKQTTGVTGAVDPQTALAMLLQGTGLTYRREGDTFLIVKAAQDPQGGSAAGGGAEVEALIVTAQKREEDIQDVPIAISAFSQEDLTRSQVAGGPDLITQVPNMTFTKTNFSSYSIQIRGIGTQAISATTDPGVAVAFNNTPFIMNRFFEQEFYDLQRVEVLRGPQGTLYGRNATAGVVNIISQKPKFIYEAKLSGDLSNYNSSRIEGMVNIPLVEDAVALRLAGAWTKRDGYAFNEINGGPIDGRDLWSTRVSLRVSPVSGLDMNLIWEHFEEEDDRLRSGKQLCKKHVVTEVGGVQVQSFDQRVVTAGIQAPWVAVQPRFSQGCIRESLYSPDSFQTPNGASVPYYVPLGGIGLAAAFFDPYVSQEQSRDLRVIESTVDPRYRANADLGELQITFDLTDELTLASETAYATDEVWSTQDFNRFNTVGGAFCITPTNAAGGCSSSGVGGPVIKGVMDDEGYFIDPQIGRANRLVAVDLSTAESTQFNQEFRLSSDFDGPFNFSLGANFTRFDLEAKYYVFINSLSLVTLGSPKSSYSADHQFVPGVSDNRQCMSHGLLLGDPTAGGGNYDCIYVEPNAIDALEDQGHNYFLSKNPYRLISYAVFGETYYNVTDNLKITAGLRWTVDKKHAPLIPSWTLEGHSRGYPVLEVLDQEWREPTGRLTIDWKPELAFTNETLVYASYAHGYKAGGANPPPYVGRGVALSETRPKTFDAEFVDAYELGAKNTLADGRVTLNLAAFYYDYKDYQISEIVDRAAFNRNFDSEVWGAEIEADWRPLDNLRLGLKGGYQKTRIADGESAVDLMDRTAGNPDWVVVRPWPTVPSSCILPTAMATHAGFFPQAPGEDPIFLGDPNPTGQLWDLGQQGGSAGGGCEFAYRDGLDPVTHLPYVPYPTVDQAPGFLGHWGSGNYPGFNPAWAPNNGEGFSKPLGGNELPNAPNWTWTITGDYTLPLVGDWLVNLHTDLHWQAESWWRIFNDHEYNRLDAYFTMNLAAIFTNEEAGWNIMAYVKNVTDETAITGAFLNSDDTGLTSNVFLTEPRLYGLRVTKAWTGGPLLGGFGERRDGPYPFEIEIGGQVQRHDAPNDPLTPGFMGEFSEALNPLENQHQDLDWGDGRHLRLRWRPAERWNLGLGVRYGKTNGTVPWAEKREIGDIFCSEHPFFCSEDIRNYGYEPIALQKRYNYTISTTRDLEEHTIVDFEVGRDIGMGLFEVGSSNLAAGLRYADLGSATHAHIFGQSNWDIPDSTYYPPGQIVTHDRFEAKLRADREFKGVGPTLTWDAFTSLFGDRNIGTLGVDWSLSAGVLFGERKVSITGTEIEENYSEAAATFQNPGGHWPAVTTSTPVNIQRSEDVTAPVYGASLGLSYKIDRFAIGAGYRWERYQDAIDGGFSETQEEDRTIDGPYFKVSVGFGG